MNTATTQEPRHLPVNDALLREIVQRIVERFQPHRIILFGSRARADHRPDSDVDLFVEMETDAKPWERRLGIRSLFRDRWWSMDILVYTPEEVAERRRSLISIVPVIEQEGKVLYERKAR